MLLTELTIENYKSFSKEVKFRFEPGFNILLGSNSSGKSTVLEAIRFRDLRNVPHRSIENIPERDSLWTHASLVGLKIDMNISEIYRLMTVNSGLKIPICDSNGNSVALNEDIERHFNSKPISFVFSQGPGDIPSLAIDIFGTVTAKRWRNTPPPVLNVQFTPEGKVIYPLDRLNLTSNDDVSDIDFFSLGVNNSIYKFAAERVSRATSGASNEELASDASNLAFCLNHLSTSDPATFNDLNKFLHRIFPNIYSVSAIPSGSVFEIKVNMLPADLRRKDLAIPIDRVGTGVTNALAMLYVLLTSHSARIILLEEPNSYLHPRALRDLLSIMAEVGSHHQFFITTHSSDVLRNVPLGTVTLLEHDGIKSSARRSTKSNLQDFNSGLIDLGIRLTDLYGCDRVLWVEGETEEAIFPKVIEHFFAEIAQGVATLRLHATGDFEARAYRANKVVDIYLRLSESTFLAPPMVAITLDREGKQQAVIDKIIKDGKGFLYFLPRPMVEDYLLFPEAIQSVFNKKYDREVSLAVVKDAMTIALNNPENRVNPRGDLFVVRHAAKILEEVFVSLGGPSASYKKTIHGPLIADWLLMNKPGELDELRDWMSLFLRPSVTDTA